MLLSIAFGAICLLATTASLECGKGAQKVSPSDLAHRIITQTPIDLPALYRSLRIDGFVIVLIGTDSTGNVECLRLISGHPLLAPGVIDSVKAWKFDTKFANAKREPISGQLIIHFTSGSEAKVVDSTKRQ